MKRIQAILLTDLKDFTEITSRVDSESLESFVQKHCNDVERIVGAYGGKIVKFLGDGFLCVFNSVIDAVRCARELRMLKLELSGHEFEMKIAINAGEIVIDEKEDIYGEPVNAVFRIIEGMDGGGICLTEIAYLLSYPEDAEKVGVFNLKGISQPIVIYSLKSNGKKMIIRSTEDIHLFQKRSPFWRQVVAFYIDILVVSIFSLAIGSVLKPWIAFQKPGFLLSKSLAEPDTIQKNEQVLLQVETPIGQIGATKEGVEVKTPIGGMRAEPGKIVIESGRKPLLRLNYLHISGIEIFVFVLYLALFWTFVRGKTVGNWLTQTMVIDTTTGKPPSFKQSVIRAILIVLAVLPAGLGIILPILLGRGTLHNRLTRTRVVVEI